MIARCSASMLVGIAALALAGCASPDPLEGERTVFRNPLATDRTGIGPQCDVDIGRDATCLGAPLVYNGGRNALFGHGETERLTRQQRRILRERAELLEVLREQPPAPPAPPPPPIAADAGATP